MEDEVLTIYDEIRDKPGGKRDNRFNDDPVLIHKKETDGDEADEDEQEETIEIVSPGPKVDDDPHLGSNLK